MPPRQILPLVFALAALGCQGPRTGAGSSAIEQCVALDDGGTRCFDGGATPSDGAGSDGPGGAVVDARVDDGGPPPGCVVTDGGLLDCDGGVPAPDGGPDDGGVAVDALVDSPAPDAPGPDAGDDAGLVADAGLDAPPPADAGLDAPAPADAGVDAPLACTLPPPPLPALPNLKRRFELKGKDELSGGEIKIGAELQASGDNGPPGVVCEATSKASLFAYLFIVILGQEAGASISGNGSYSKCATKRCDAPPTFNCGAPTCTAAHAGLSLAGYRGVEIDACKKLKLDRFWIGRQLCKAAQLKLSGRLGFGGTVGADSDEGTPVGSCGGCCANGNPRGFMAAGPQGLVEAKGTGKFKLWKLELELGVGAKGCLALAGKVGQDCDGGLFAEPAVHGYSAVCIESAVIPGGGFKIINNEAELCLPLGFYDWCTTFPRCLKTGDAGRACPSGSTNPE